MSTVTRIPIICPTLDDIGTEDEFCVFPFKFDSKQRFECVERSNSGLAECKTNKDQWKMCSDKCPLMKYHSHDELISDLQGIEKLATSNFAELFTLGKSVLNANLTGIRLRSSTAAAEEDDLRPLVKLVGNMHGNEPTGRELLIHLAKFIVLAHKYEILEDLPRRAANLLTTTDLWILPTMNPDGQVLTQQHL